MPKVLEWGNTCEHSPDTMTQVVASSSFPQFRRRWSTGALLPSSLKYATHWLLGIYVSKVVLRLRLLCRSNPMISLFYAFCERCDWNDVAACTHCIFCGVRFWVWLQPLSWPSNCLTMQTSAFTRTWKLALTVLSNFRWVSPFLVDWNGAEYFIFVNLCWSKYSARHKPLNILWVTSWISGLFTCY